MLDKDVSPVESESDSEETGIHIDREQALAEKEKVCFNYLDFVFKLSKFINKCWIFLSQP